MANIISFDELIKNVETSYEKSNAVVSNFTKKRVLDLNALKLSKERLIEERDSLSADFATRDDVVDNYNRSSRQDVINDYNNRISLVEQDIVRLEDPSDAEILKITDEVIERKRELYAEIRKVEDLKTTMKREARRLDYEISEWKYKTESQKYDDDYWKMNAAYDKIQRDIKWLDVNIVKFNDLIKNLELFLVDVRKMKDQRINDIISRKDDEPTIEPTGDAEPTIEPTGDDEPTIEPTGDDEPTIEPTGDDEPTIEPTGDEYKPEEAIQKIIESLTPDMSDEEIESRISIIDQLLFQIYIKDQNEFENKLNSTKGVIPKLNLISSRIKDIIDYHNFYKHSDVRINSILNKHKNLVFEKIGEDYDRRQTNGQYCWKNFYSLKDAHKYLTDKFKGNDYLREQFVTLLLEMKEIINKPEEERYNNWKNSCLEYCENASIDREIMSHYLTAEAKELNNGLVVNNEFNINGLIILKREEEKPKKKNRLKVVAKKALNWMKEHKLATIAIGLALAGGTLMMIPGTQMMINSALWTLGTKLGWSSASLAKLHGTNLALSKAVAGGKYVFDAGSGLYTLGGAVGAKALYTSGSAKLLGALEGLLVGGSLTTGLTAAVKSIVNKIKEKRNKKLARLNSNTNDVITSEISENVDNGLRGYVPNEDGKTGTWHYEGGFIPVEYEQMPIEEEHSMHM